MTRTALYRHWDADKNLLYVGISLSAIARLGQHIAGSHWSDEISSVTIQQYPDRDSAIIAERRAIAEEAPLYNIAHADNDNTPLAARGDGRDWLDLSQVYSVGWRNPGPMGADEYRAALKSLGITQTESARLLGVDIRTSQKWANGERSVPKPAVMLLTYMGQHGTGLASILASRAELSQ